MRAGPAEPRGGALAWLQPDRGPAPGTPGSQPALLARPRSSTPAAAAVGDQAQVLGPAWGLVMSQRSMMQYNGLCLAMSPEPKRLLVCDECGQVLEQVSGLWAADALAGGRPAGVAAGAARPHPERAHGQGH